MPMFCYPTLGKKCAIFIFFLFRAFHNVAFVHSVFGAA